jgi:RNA polymerase primary sigma factor
MTSMRPVAHGGRPFRDRRIAHADLIREGFCGLLEAIDRFDLSYLQRWRPKL